MCLAFFKNLFAKKAAPEMVAPFVAVVLGGSGAVGSATDTLIQSVTRENTNSGAASSSNHLFGLMWKKGDVPSSASVVAKVSGVEVRASFVNRSYYPDGSLYTCHAAIDDTTIAASSSRDYDFYVRPSSSFDDTDPGTSLTTLLAAHDFKTEITSATAYYQFQVQIQNGNTTAAFPGFFKTGYTLGTVTKNGATVTLTTDFTITNGSGTTFQGQTGYDGVTLTLTSPSVGDSYMILRATWQHMSGAMLAKFTDGDVSGAVDKVIASPCVERWLFRAYVKDGSTGAGSADTHLKEYFHLTRWNNSNGTEKALYATAVPAQEEIAVANKTRLDYSLVFKDGTTTLGTYSSLQHPYHAQFATVKQADDTNHARAVCVSGSECWLITSRDKSYMRRCEGFYPFKSSMTPTDITPTSANSTHDPFSTQAHIDFIDAGGESYGRGLMPLGDVIAWMKPSAANNRLARVCAHAGLHVGYHYRQPYGSSAIASPFVHLMDTHLADDTTTRWNGDGLPNGSYISADNRPATDGENGGYVAYAGGTGDWILSGGASHAPAYCAYQWFEEGEEYFLQAHLDHFTNLAIQKVGDIYGNRRGLQWSGAGGGYSGFSGLGIPTGQWSSTYIIEDQQERGTAWAANIALWAETCPAARAYYDYVHALVMHMDNYLNTFLAYAPAALTATGTLYVREDVESTWQQHFIVHQSCRGKRQLASPGYTALATHVATYAIGHITGNLFKTIAYHGDSRTKSSAYDPSTNPFLAASDHLTLQDVSYVAATNTITIDWSSDSSIAAVRANLLHNDDEVYVSTITDSLGGVAAIPGLTVGTKYFVINVAQPTSTTITFQLSTSSGGSAVDITGTTGNGTIMTRFLGSDGGAGTGPVASDYPRIALAAAICAYEAGITIATSNGSKIDTMEAWLSAQDYSANPRWEVERT